MPRNCDEDSGRSSCSANSLKVSPIITHSDNVTHETVRLRKFSKDGERNADLKISSRPRSYVGILKSPDDRDPFPSCKIKRNLALFNTLDTPLFEGLSNAHSTFDVVTSTQLEENGHIPNALSLLTIRSTDDQNFYLNKQKNVYNNFRRGKPVQRAASRLYRADKGESKAECIGPEFIVRASQKPKQIDLTHSITNEKAFIKVVLLNGQNVEIICEPNVVTAGEIFEALVKCEKYEHNFMLGVAVLINGDFIFLPDDYKIKKIAPANWSLKFSKKNKVEENIIFTVFLRINFFLPTNIARNIQGGDWRYRVYLQLRRSTVEGQLTSTLPNLILLTGYALHIEFGEFSFREHGSGDYFLLEHYLPEGYITDNMSEVKLRMKRAHESRRGLDKNKAIINYIMLAQSFRDYGAHFYSAIWATRDGFCRDVWLSIGPRGITLYSRNNIPTEFASSANRIVLQSLPWHHIHTFYYNKKSLYIIPNSNSGLSKMGVKYKLKMSDNISYFAFWLASLHHRLYLKLYAKEDFINFLSDELGCPLDRSTTEVDCSNYQDSYNLAVRNQYRKPLKSRFKVDIFEKKVQNKENKKPSTEELLRQILSAPSKSNLNQSAGLCDQGNSSNECLSSSESSLPRRQGVKMGTKVFNGMKSRLPNKHPQSPVYSGTESIVRSDADLTMTQSDSDELCSNSERISRNCKVNSMKLLPERHYAQTSSENPTAFVLESPKVYQEAFSYNINGSESCIDSSLYERFENMGCVQGERIFVTATIQRDETKALGLQVAEGSDGNVYIKSITSGGPADISKKLLAGDQIISVNGQTLLNIKYEKALSMLQSAPRNVELIVLQNNTKSPESFDLHSSNKEANKFKASLLESNVDDADITDDELLNEEALKTIYALIKLTKDKVINRMKEKGSLNTPNRKYLQKCLSENKVYDESDSFSSQNSTPQKSRDQQKFNTWRGQINYRPKRRPLSLSIPTDVNIPDNYLSEDFLMKQTSLKCIQNSLNNLDNETIHRNVALPRNYGLSRKWLGPVRYPVTPCKSDVENSAMLDKDVVKRRFVYGADNSDDGQIFL